MATIAMVMGIITATLGWFIWFLFFATIIYLIGIIFLIPPVLAIVLGIITINNEENELERRKGAIAICLGATGPFIGWFAFLFFLLMRRGRK